MRVTNAMVSRNYISNLQRNYGDLNKYSRQVYSGRRYEKMSEDTSAAVRAMQVRQKLDRIPSYISNAQSTLSHFAAAENSLMQVSEVNQSVQELFVRGMNDTEGSDERGAITKQLENLQEQLLGLANGQFAGKYMFGGTNTITQPFTTKDLYTNDNPPVLIQSNALHYNGQPVYELNTGSPLFNDAAYVDVGLGIEKDEDGNIIPNSVFKGTLVGLEFMGTGPDNLYDLLGNMIDTLKSGVPDKSAAGQLLDKFIDASAHANLMMTTIGADTKYLDFTVERLETEEDTLIERQDQLEFISPEEAILDFKMQEYVYNAALQMGQRLLQPTLFDFVK